MNRIWHCRYELDPALSSWTLLTTDDYRAVLGYTALLHRGRCDLRWVDYSTVRRMITTMSARRHHSGLVHVIGTTISLWISRLVHYFVDNDDDDAVDHWYHLYYIGIGTLADYFGDVKVTT